MTASLSGTIAGSWYTTPSRGSCKTGFRLSHSDLAQTVLALRKLRHPRQSSLAINDVHLTSPTSMTRYAPVLCILASSMWNRLSYERVNVRTQMTPLTPNLLGKAQLA